MFAGKIPELCRERLLPGITPSTTGGSGSPTTTGTGGSGVGATSTTSGGGAARTSNPAVGLRAEGMEGVVAVGWLVGGLLLL